MVKHIFAALAGMSMLAGCATTNTVYARPTQPAPIYNAPPVQSIYANVPRAPLHSELFSCGRWGSNLGEIGLRGEAVLYTPYINTPAGPILRTPVEGACLSSGFGWRGTATGGGRQHNGMDLANSDGGYIYAAGDGWIRHAGWRNGFGNVVEIDHGQNVRTLYAHLEEIDPALAPGGFVYGGAAIGRMGATGNATGVHLHYEVFVEGMIVDPLNYGRPPTMVSAPAPEDAMLPPAPSEQSNY